MQPLAFYYLRTPLISLTQLLDLLDGGDLVTFIKQPVVGEALFLASPTLYNQIESDPQLQSEKLRQTLLKYAIRMGSRSTPFGLFAGCWLGHVNKTTSLDITARQLRCHYRLSSSILGKLLQQLNDTSALGHSLAYRVNTSLYSIGQVHRYVEIDSSSSPARFFTSQLKGNSALRFVLRLARQANSFRTYVNGLTQLGYTECESQAFVEQLIADQVLVSELSLNVTGADALSRLIEIIQRIPEGKSAGRNLIKLNLLLAQGTPVQIKHKAVQDLLNEQFKLALSDQPILQGDTLFAGQGHQLSASLIGGLQKSLQNLLGLHKAIRPAETLSSFKKAFYARYGDQEIPLSLALDADTGIGYGVQPVGGDMPIMETLLSASPENVQPQDTAHVSPEWNDWLLKRYDSWQTQNSPILELTDADVAGWTTASISLPDSFYTMGYFLAASPKELDSGRYKFRCKIIAGPSAFSLLGRFCGADDELNKHIQQAYQQQQKQHPDLIYAEIVHLPTSAVGNVVQRPHLSEYEIPYLGHSTLPLDKQIPITDLWISVPNGDQIVLRSRRLKKQIVPRLTTAHNYLTGLPVYWFLCDLQQQEKPLMVQWQWGCLNAFRYLPRVEYRQIILQEARWRLDSSDVQDTLTVVENVTRWRQIWHWPRFVSLAQADQVLFLDLDNTGCQKLLFSTLRRLTSLEVFEWLQTPSQCCVQGPDGPLTHEVILPFTTASSSNSPSLAKIRSSRCERTFIPGSEWLYLKIYGGPQVCRRLVEQLGKLARSWMRTSRISQWFFIRYHDPDLHLRFRFHLTDKTDYTRLLSDCQQQLNAWIESGEIHRVQIDTYHREIERYGIERIENTERLFWADSDTVLSIHQFKYNEQLLLIAALRGSDQYLTDFGFELVTKTAFCKERFESLFQQHKGQADLQKQLAQLYRQHGSMLTNILTIDQTQGAENERIIELFNKRSQLFKPFLSHLFPSTELLHGYVASLIHLFINRLFNQNQRSYELLVYHLLVRHYQFQMAQQVRMT